MEYFRDIVITSALCGIIISLTPESEKGAGKYIKYLTSLTLLLVILAPLSSLRTSADEISNAVRGFFSSADSDLQTQNAYSSAISMNASALSDSLTDSILGEFDLAEDDLAVTITLDTSDPTSLTVASVTVKLRTNTDPTAVQAYIQSLGFDNCTVTKGASP